MDKKDRKKGLLETGTVYRYRNPLLVRHEERPLALFLMVLLLLVSLEIPVSSPADAIEEQIESPHKRLIDELRGFFKEIDARVILKEDGYLRIDAGLSKGMLRYMRFDVVSSRTIRHPVTGEELGTADVKTGTVEITEVSEKDSRARLLSGEAEPGSRLILTGAPWRVYIQEEKGVDYFIADDYSRSLKSTLSGEVTVARFELVNDRALSDITITLSLQGNSLFQKASWSDTGEVFLSSSAELQKDYLERIKKEKALYEEELKGSDLLLSFRLPGSVRFLNIADIDGDGSEELIIANDSSLEVYRLGVTLKGLYEKKIKGEPVALYSADIDSDGRAEIMVSEILDEKAYFEILGLREGDLKTLYKGSGLLRYMDGKLLTQGYSSMEGPSGDIKELLIPTMDTIPLNLKVKTDLFGFAFLCRPEHCITLVHDDSGYINLFDSEGRLISRSKNDTGGFFFTFKKANPSPFLKEEERSLKDRLIKEDDRIYLIRRRPVAGLAKGLGWSSSEIISIKWMGGNNWGQDIIEESLKEVGGAIVDFYLAKDRLYILQKPFMGISLGSLLKGENPRQTRLYIFKR